MDHQKILTFLDGEIDNGACISNAFDTVYVHRKPTTAFSGNDQFLCEASGATLGASPLSFGFGYWTQISGNPVTFSDTTDPTTTITFSGAPIWPDTVTLRWTVVNDSANATCVAFDEITLYNRTGTGTAYAGPDDTSCNDITYQLAALPVASDSGTGRWFPHSYPGVAPTFNNAAIPNAIANLTTSGEYVFVWEVSNGVCPPRYDSVTVFLIRANAGNDVIICMDDTANQRMRGDTVPGIPGTWSSASAGLYWNPNGVRGADTAFVHGVTAGTHTVTYTVSSGSCTVTDNMIILASDPPSAANAGTDQTGLCQDTAILQANIPAIGSGVWTQASGPNTAIMTDFDSAYNVIQGLVVGTYKFYWTISNQPCTAERDSVLIQVSRLPHSTQIISIANPYCVNKGSLTGQANPIALPLGTYEFSITSATTGYQLNPTFNGLDTGTYNLWSRDVTFPACVSQASIPAVLVDTMPRLVVDSAYFTPAKSCNGTITRGSITTVVSGGQGTITYNLLGSFTATNTTGVFLNLPSGTYTVKATDSLNCPIDVISNLFIPEFKCDTLYRGIPVTGGTDTTCLQTTGTGGPYDIGSCNGTDGTYNGILFSVVDSCIIFPTNVLAMPLPFRGDTACVIICDTITQDSMSVVICDTNTIIYYPIPVPDTIVTLLPSVGGVVVCADTSELIGDSFSYSSCRGATAGIFNRGSANCYTYIPLLKQIDTTCVIVCDEYNVCDTTYFVFIPSLTEDTVITTDTVVCVDTTEMPGGYHTVTGCDGNSPTTSRGGGTVTIDPLTGCVTISPSFGVGKTDTTCIIVCDTLNNICDTMEKMN